MKRISILLSALTLVVAGAFPVASAMADQKIGVISLSKVLSESADWSKQKAALRKQFAPQQKKLEASQTALKKEMGKLQSDQAVMTADQLTQLQHKISLERANMQAMQQQMVLNAEYQQNQASAAFLSKVNDAIQAVAKAGNYDLILRAQGVPFVGDKLDITSQVVAQLAK